MKISIDWLKDYISLDLSNTQVISTLNRIGMLVDEWEEIEDDTILELETYANRPDTLGHLGVARELAAALGLPLNMPDVSIIENDKQIAEHFDIQIMDEDLCPRYCGMIVSGIEVGPSPDWLQKRLRALGLIPVNNVVDVTNYVLFATAQPIHAFDLAKLNGSKIMVRRAKRGEGMRTLEGRDVALSQDMLVIADEKDPVALAGVIGGEVSAVSEATRDVLIESAYFDPVSVRQTWKKAGVQTDASYRFERGADIMFPPHAAALAVTLLTQMGGVAYQGVLDVYPKPARPKTVVIRHHRLLELLGAEIEEAFVTKTLKDLEFQVKEQQPGIWQVTVPTFRVDIEREADLIEEIARFFGYENIPSRLPLWETVDLSLDRKRTLETGVRQLMFHQGFDEVVNYSFTDPAREELFRRDRGAIAIRNPISTRASLLRTTLLNGLLQTVVWNKNRGVEGVHVFELGHIFSQEEEDKRELQAMGMITWGALDAPHWQGGPGLPTDFFHLKGTCESLVASLGYQVVSFQNRDHPFFEAGHALALYLKGAEAGILGRLKPEILEAYDLNEPVWAAEIDLDVAFEIQPHVFRFVPVVKYPSVIRDVSFLIDRGVPYQDIKEILDRLNLPYLERHTLYDRYTGAGVPEGKVSLSLRFVFRHPQKTLQAGEVDALQEKIGKALRSSFEIQLREGGEN
ncbi:MAG: phenylalanine--tRNA ligase subunit beta [Candidatus Aminicenantaceae bacterium]